MLLRVRSQKASPPVVIVWPLVPLRITVLVPEVNAPELVKSPDTVIELEPAV
ncbi:MAG: hypothetical protein KKE55_07300 [Candidatus Omnitrophica bacterium]|nr:hypothetical protein [Candidatus Omnitrophota bacterium]